MDMRQIMYVIELSKNGSLNQTAQKMFLSKPNLSYAIKSLESELGFDIFDRTTSGMRLTNSGKQFVDYARPVYQQFQYLQNVCSNMASANSPVLSVSTVSLKFVGNIFTEIYKENLGENVVFKYYEDTNSNVVDNVANSISDIGIVIFTSPQLKTWKRLIKVRHLTYHKITTEPPFVILGKHNPLFYKDTESVTLDEMLPFPYISSPPEILSIDDDRLEISRHLMHQQKKTHLSLTLANYQSCITAPHRQRPIWPVQRGGSAFISVRVITPNGKEIEYTNNGTPLEKKCALLFRALTGVKPPYTVKWQIVNTGFEAQNANCLRGYFEKSDVGINGKRESTLYSGTHSVQCFIIKRGICVAKSREFIVNIQ